MEHVANKILLKKMGWRGGVVAAVTTTTMTVMMMTAVGTART
jgi:hypothetical protein